MSTCSCTEPLSAPSVTTAGRKQLWQEDTCMCTLGQTVAVLVSDHCFMIHKCQIMLPKSTDLKWHKSDKNSMCSLKV